MYWMHNIDIHIIYTNVQLSGIDNTISMDASTILLNDNSIKSNEGGILASASNSQLPAKNSLFENSILNSGNDGILSTNIGTATSGDKVSNLPNFANNLKTTAKKVTLRSPSKFQTSWIAEYDKHIRILCILTT